MKGKATKHRKTSQVIPRPLPRQLNMQPVKDALAQATHLDVTARSEATRLIANYLIENGARDLEETHLGSETKFHLIQQSPQGRDITTGIVDRKSRVDNQFIITDFKTKKDSKWLKEPQWAEEIATGIQPYTYGWLASTEVKDPKVKIQIRIIAVVRSSTTVFWEKLIHVLPMHIERAKQAYQLRARTIRGMREAAKVKPSLPWNFTGRHCHDFHRPCEFLTDCTRLAASVWKGNETDYAKLGWSSDLSSSRIKPNDVIMSPSSFEVGTLCMEKYRRTHEMGARSNEELESGYDAQVGLAFHLGMDAFYKANCKLTK